MRFPFYISRRYLFSPKSHGAINVITFISMVAIAVGTAALVLVLSVFNGLSGFIEGLFSAIDSDLRIVSAKGESIEDQGQITDYLRAHPQVAMYCRTVEKKAGLKYQDRQALAIIKGVEPAYLKMNPIASPEYLYDGHCDFSPVNGTYKAILGSQVAARLNANLYDLDHPMQIFVRNKGKIRLGDPTPGFKREYLYPAGYFSVQREYDEKYVLTDFTFAQELLGMQGQVSSYEIILKPQADLRKVKNEIATKIGKDFKVQTIEEQHTALYKVMRNEKYVSYLILLLLLVIASVNIVGSLTMIVLEKTRDIAVLKSYGATDRTILQIFLAEGFWIGAIGAGAGGVLGGGIGYLQEKFQLIQLNGGDTFRLQALPLAMQWNDFCLIFFTVLFLAIFAALFPARNAAFVQIAEGLRR